ncbi:MAG: hypothetical protein AB1938_02925 [Myxococcota bacterium]
MKTLMVMLALSGGSSLFLSACGSSCANACNNNWNVCGAEWAISGSKFDFNRCVSICETYEPVGACTVDERVACEASAPTCGAFRKCDECTK